MSGVHKNAAAKPAAEIPPDPTPSDVLALFSLDRIEKMIVEGFALAFERRMQGTSMDNLLETLQFVADLRLFKEGLCMTSEQVCSLLQISMRTFERYKAEGKIEVDPSIGAGSPRYSLLSILATRARLLQEAGERHAQTATVATVKTGRKRH